MRHIRYPGRALGLALAVVLLGQNHPVLGVEPTKTIEASQGLKHRVQALQADEEYLAAFAAGVDRLKVTIPPTDETRDECLDAIADLVYVAAFGGQYALADELSSLLLKESKEYYGSNDVRTAAAWRLFGGMARVTRSYTEAWMALDESRCILETRGELETYEYSKWLWVMGNWYRRVSPITSLAYLGRGMELRDELDPRPTEDNASVTTWVAWLLLQLGRHDEARVYFERARDIYLGFGHKDNSTLGVALAGLGDLAAVDGDWAAAEQQYREAARIFEIAWRKCGVTNRNISFRGYEMIAFAQVRQGKNEDAWQSLQKYRAGQALRASVGSASWRVRADPDYEAIRNMHEKLLHKRASQQSITESPHVTSATWGALVDQLELATRCAKAETDYLLKHPIPEASLKQLQRVLPDNAAYAGWLDAKAADGMAISTGPFLNARWMYVVTRDTPIRWRPIYDPKTRADDDAMRKGGQAFNAITNRASTWRERLDNDPELASASRDVYRTVFGDGVCDLPGVKRLIMEVACYTEWIQSDALIDPVGHYLSERYSVSYSPSATVYVALSESRHRQKEGDPRVLAIGDPVFPSPAASNAMLSLENSRIDEILLRDAVKHDPAALDKLPRLPYSGRELDRMQAMFPYARVLRGSEATEPAVNRLAETGALGNYDIVHIASHALIDRSPEHCALVLSRTSAADAASSDGLIDTPEISMGWKLNAQLVTLSACQTAGVGFNGGEPAGFAQALFQAGARCVLLSLWKVDDEATSLLMSRFYEDIAAYGKEKKPVSYSDALAEAKNWLRTYTDNKGSRPFAHPVYWSAFVLIGVAD